LSTGFERLGELLFKGIEIYASIEAPDSIASAFPTQEAPSLIAKPKLPLSKLSAKEDDTAV